MEKDKFSALKQYYAENWWKIYSTIDNPKVQSVQMQNYERLSASAC